MDNNETNGKEMLEKYEKLTEEEQKGFWAILLLLLSFVNNEDEVTTDRKETEG